MRMRALVTFRMRRWNSTRTCVTLDSRLSIKCRYISFYRNAHAYFHRCSHEGTEIPPPHVSRFPFVYKKKNLFLPQMSYRRHNARIHQPPSFSDSTPTITRTRNLSLTITRTLTATISRSTRDSWPRDLPPRARLDSSLHATQPLTADSSDRGPGNYSVLQTQNCWNLPTPYWC